MELAHILKDQRRDIDDEIKKKRIMPREAETHFREALNSKLIKVITGIRRCGKSVLIYSALKGSNFAYMNFDDERLYSLDSDRILPAFYEIYGENVKILFLDEIQNMGRWELFVNRLHRAGFNLYITGSNAKLLSKELATHLTGRHLKIELQPFSFNEYLKAKGFNDDINTTKGRTKLKLELKRYIQSGGFPEVIMENENPGLYLRELYGNIIEKDIIGRYAIEHKKTFREMAISLISNTGRSVSYNKLKNQYNLGSEHTTKNYLLYLEEAYLLFVLSRFSNKVIEIEKSDKKVYATDIGFVTHLSVSSSPDYGRNYETIVAISLFGKKCFTPGMEVYYWKSALQEEVDFVIREKRKVSQLIQVCYNIDNYDTRKREVKALLKASNELKCNNLLVITDEKEAEEKVSGKKIKYIPLWKWLLKSEP
ncbi:MAG: ATP-binding protein [Nanoarchaeota archaeon]